MSPSLHVNGFKLRNLDPKLRSDLEPRWKRPRISREAAAVSCCDRLAVDGSESPREVQGRRGAALVTVESLKEPSWVESWGCQLA